MLVNIYTFTHLLIYLLSISIRIFFINTAILRNLIIIDLVIIIFMTNMLTRDVEYHKSVIWYSTALQQQVLDIITIIKGGSAEQVRVTIFKHLWHWWTTLCIYNQQCLNHIWNAYGYGNWCQLVLMRCYCQNYWVK